VYDFEDARIDSVFKVLPSLHPSTSSPLSSHHSSPPQLILSFLAFLVFSERVISLQSNNMDMKIKELVIFLF
jgi:hypothetical protein